jgi:hypothetical protein
MTTPQRTTSEIFNRERLLDRRQCLCPVLLQKQIHKNEEAQDKQRGGNISGEQEETKEEEKAVGQSSSTNASSRCLAS